MKILSFLVISVLLTIIGIGLISLMFIIDYSSFNLYLKSFFFYFIITTFFVAILFYLNKKGFFHRL